MFVKVLKGGQGNLEDGDYVPAPYGISHKDINASEMAKLSLLDFDRLWRLLDWLGGDSFQEVIRRIVGLKVREKPDYYLRWASEVGCVVAGRGAIEAGALSGYLDKDTDWWSAIAHLRPSWQIELSRITWEQALQLVDRPSDSIITRPNGRKRPRRREKMLRQRRLSWAKIAERFDPAQCECSDIP